MITIFEGLFSKTQMIFIIRNADLLNGRSNGKISFTQPQNHSLILLYYLYLPWRKVFHPQMELLYNKAYINLQNLIKLSRGDKTQMLKYLNQFQELMPQRVENLKSYLNSEDRKMIRQTLHQMSPQLQFFGIPKVIIPIQRLEHEYMTIPSKDLQSIVNEIVIKLDNATNEIAIILKNHF